MIKLLVSKHTAVFVAAVLIVILGAVAYVRLPRESAPEMKQPWVFITTVYPGVSPRDIESLITRPIEEEIDGLEGVTQISSSSRQSVSSIFVEFAGDVAVETALRKTKERVDAAKAGLPSDAKDPAVREFTSSDWPIFIVMLSHPEGIGRIDDAARALQDRLKRVYGVLDVEIAGNLEKEIAVELDPIRLQHYDLTLDDVAEAIRNENVAIPGGVLKSQSKSYSLAVTGEIREPELFKDIIIRSDLLRIRLGDLGQVNFQNTQAESYSRLNGTPAIALEVKKRAGHDLISVVDKVKDEIEKMKPGFPPGTEITHSYDESRYIHTMISDLENNMFTGFLLVLGVTIFFLGWRNSLFVSLAIPLSMLISFFVLELIGVTLNMIVLFSLILSLGMLVDNGIVIVENIFRHASMGKTRSQAAIDGAREVAKPIIASTVTTCLAFFPIMFMPGIMGDFMSYLPLTVIIVLSASLVVALTVNPVFCSRFLRISAKEQKKILEGGGGFAAFQSWYERVLRKALKRPLLVVAASLILVIAGFGVYGLIGKEPVFFPNLDPSTAVIELKARQGTPLEETDRLVRKIEAIIPSVPASMEHFQITTGSEGGEEFHKATIRVEFKPYLEREISGTEGTENLRRRLDDFTGAEITFRELSMGPPSGHPVSYEVVGREYSALGERSSQILAILESHPELKLINSDFEPAKPEVSVEIDRQKAAYYGVSTRDIAKIIRDSINGLSVGKFRMDEEEYDIVVRYMDNYRDTVSRLNDVQVIGNGGARIPIQAVADITFKSSVGLIKRKNLKRTVEVWADFKLGVQNKTAVKTDIRKRVQQLSLPAGYLVETGEGAAMQQESSDFLVRAFGIALFLILVVLIGQFNSITDPAIILFSVFLSMGGVLWGYALSGQVFIIVMSGIGCIALAGVAVNNCIVLVDYTNVLIKSGQPWREAIIQAGRARLRPVLLTAITTVLGMIPMALGVSFDFHVFTLQVGSEQSMFWQAFAWAMIYGLSFATVMTLVVVPTMLTLKFSVRDRRNSRKERMRALSPQDDGKQSPGTGAKGEPVLEPSANN